MEQSLLRRRAGTYFLLVLVCLLALWVTTYPFVDRWRDESLVRKLGNEAFGGEIPDFLVAESITTPGMAMRFEGPTRGFAISLRCGEDHREQLLETLEQNGFCEARGTEMLAPTGEISVPEVPGRSIFLYQFAKSGRSSGHMLAVRRSASREFELELVLDTMKKAKLKR
jgi:hypothetical protein